MESIARNRNLVILGQHHVPKLVAVSSRLLLGWWQVFWKTLFFVYCCHFFILSIVRFGVYASFCSNSGFNLLSVLKEIKNRQSFDNFEFSRLLVLFQRILPLLPQVVVALKGFPFPLDGLSLLVRLFLLRFKKSTMGRKSNFCILRPLTQLKASSFHSLPHLFLQTKKLEYQF